MSFLDKMTKAVGDVVDKGKKDVDQFMRIQKINGEISGMEKKIAEFNGQIQQVTQETGAKAIALLRSGTFASAELQPFLEKVIAFEQQIAAEEAAIAAKKADIERIKAEHEAEHASVAPASAEPAAPAQPATPPPLPTAAPAPAPGAKFCPQCGTPATSGTFCASCGAKLG
jgi:hypothetical protein